MERSIQKLISLPEGMPGHFHELENKDPDAWFCDSDPPGQKVGSGGGSAHMLWSAYQQSDHKGSLLSWLDSGKRMIIHSGGESRRLPAYAPYGKSLLPMPVFRWSKGQYLDQKLLDFQTAYYERILQKAPDPYSLLIGSGDVMFLSSDRFHQLPEADLLVFGIWVEDEVATRHGVFFSRKEQPEELAFVKQKPSMEELRDHARKYFYLMDSGIVLMNSSTALKLMKLCGWDDKRQAFKGGAPSFYDLYSDLLTVFGSETDSGDPELAGLSVKLVPLHEGEFYHFGSNKDLISSTLRLQNRVTDQRLRHSSESDHHPSIFQQNAEVRTSFNDSNHHLWIENSHVPESWTLQHHHILTGIPKNQWKVDLPAHICLDVVPMEEERYCLRLYGFEDDFRTSPEEGACWMNRPLTQWLEERNTGYEQAAIDPGASLFDTLLFPTVKLEEIPEMLDGMLKAGADPGPWLSAERLSARKLSERADKAALYQQRQALKMQSLPKLAANHSKSIFYHLDLELAARDFRYSGMELPAELPAAESLVKKINDAMFRARVSGHPVQAKKWEQEAFGLLRQEMIQTLHSDPVSPVRNLMDDQILWGRSPVRLDLAGGWTDTPPHCIMEGGKVVNLSVELNGQLPLQVYVKPIDEPKIVLRSIDLGDKVEVQSHEELHSYDQVGAGFSIPKAALVLAGFGPRFSQKQYSSLNEQLKEFGCGIEISLLAAIPKGSGLGTSSNLAATVLATLSEFCGLGWDPYEVGYRTLILEQMLTSGGGWQDQFGGFFNGVKLVETDPGIRQNPTIKWLPDQLFTQPHTRDMMLLYYTGVTRVARDILGEIVKGMFLNSSQHLEIFKEMKIHAQETFEVILANDYTGLAEKVALSWDLNQRLDQGTNPPVIQEILGRVDDLLLGYKLLGAGGGGYLLMFAKSPEAAKRTRKELESRPPNPKARFVDFNISATGFQVSRS